MSHRLLSNNQPDILGRLLRSLEDLEHWKATEFKNWLLHYSVAVLRPVLNPLYLFHWTLLVGGIGILCSDSIANDDLSSGDTILQDIVFFMGILYAPTKCTMNVHLLQHFAYYVSRRGPIWAYSCSAFEGMNAFIKPLKLKGKAICVCDKLEETFDNERFNKRVTVLHLCVPSLSAMMTEIE